MRKVNIVGYIFKEKNAVHFKTEFGHIINKIVKK